MTNHVLRPSDAPNWMLCAAKPSFTLGMEDNSGEAAALGTCKHGTAETCVELGFIEADMFLGDEVDADGFTFTVDDDYIDHVNAVVQKAKELTEGATWVQTEVQLSTDLLYGEGASEKGGTADLIAYWEDEERSLYVDYKFGRKSRYVDPQLHSYGYSGTHERHAAGDGVRTVDLAIIQPVINHFDSVRLTNPELEAIGDNIKAGAAATFADNPEFTPGAEQCRYCPGKKADCPALRETVEAAVPEVFKNLDATDDETAQLAADVEIVPLVEQWCAARIAKARGLTEVGEFPGYKMVAGRQGNRQFADYDAAWNLLFKKFRIAQSNFCNFKMKTATQILKLPQLTDHPIKLRQVEAMVIRPEAKSVMVKDDDKREAIQPIAFENLENTA